MGDASPTTVQILEGLPAQIDASQAELGDDASSPKTVRAQSEARMT